MIILDERNFLAKELNARGFEIFDFYQNHKILDFKTFVSLDLKRRGEIILVDTQTVLNYPDVQLQETFKILLNTFNGAIFFNGAGNQKAIDWVENEAALFKKIIGEFSLPMPQIGWTILSNQMQFFSNMLEDQKRLQEHMANFSLELDQVLEMAQNDMMMAKKIQEAFIPRRSEEIRGIKFTNKYATGDGGGCEFFDLVQTPSKVYQVLISTQSYLISSAVIGILGSMKGNNFNPQTFLENAFTEANVIRSSHNKKADVDLLVLEIDLPHLMMISHSNSDSCFYSPINGSFKLALGEKYQLVKGENVIFFSPGFIFNWNELYPEKNLFDELKVNQLSTNELITELFFLLKKESDRKFLTKDATILMVEVNRHGIYKV
jgi:hypothetical protein